jgi:hypothetical protein
MVAQKGAICYNMGSVINQESTMLQYIERNLVEVLAFSLLFGCFSTVSAGYLLALWIFG